ncbi:hypothetical protein SBRCBS47491_000984 [Sporothrix bragantina]|uniref:Uncharacterized protein n=1 Tax=Sporothrix bragantina TaxID=671064 RepID=A0ABP0AUU8_9PEZI
MKLYYVFFRNAGAQAAPSSLIKRDDITDWTIRGLHWDCSEDSTLCVYGFSIAEETSDDAPNTPFFCHFTIDSEQGESIVRSSFSDVPCEESDNYLCSASWSDSGYMILTIDNVQESRRAYFGISDSEIEAGKFSATHHSPAYAVVPSSATVAVIPPNIHPRDYVDSEPEYEGDPENIDDDGYSAGDAASAAPKQYTTYEDPSSVVFAKEVFEDSSDTDAPASLVAGIISDTGESVPSTVNATVPDVDEAAVPDAAVDVPVDAPAATPVAVSVGTSVNTTQDLPDTPQDRVPGQFDAVPDCDDATDASIQDSDTASTSDGPTYSDGLPTVPGTPFTWSLRNVTRDVFYAPNAVSVDFMIDVLPDGQAIPCHIKVELDENVEPMFASWFLEKCENNDWYMSWGYNQMTDSAVATIINPDRTKEAWFGWDSVNALLPDIVLASAGPGIVQNCNC